MERRASKGTVEVRQGTSGPMIVGHAAVFNRNSENMGFIEQVDPAAFNRTLQQADVRGLGNHDPNWLLGRTRAGTMRLAVDDIGLRYEIDVNTKDPDGQRALAKVERGDWDGSSFAFNTKRDEWKWDSTPPQRRLLEVELIDAGPVTYPAYPDATAAARALEPIADKVGRPVDELVTALRRGEIRSLIDGQPIETEQETASMDTIIEELRAGKTLSAKSVASLEGVIQQIRDLLDVAKGEAPADSKIGDFDDEADEEQAGRSLDELNRALEVRRRAYT